MIFTLSDHFPSCCLAGKPSNGKPFAALDLVLSTLAVLGICYSFWRMGADMANIKLTISAGIGSTLSLGFLIGEISCLARLLLKKPKTEPAKTEVPLQIEKRTSIVNDTIQEIFLYLSFPDLVRTRLTSKLFKNIADSTIVNRLKASYYLTSSRPAMTVLKEMSVASSFLKAEKVFHTSVSMAGTQIGLLGSFLCSQNGNELVITKCSNDKILYKVKSIGWIRSFKIENHTLIVVQDSTIQKIVFSLDEQGIQEVDYKEFNFSSLPNLSGVRYTGEKLLYLENDNLHAYELINQTLLFKKENVLFNGFLNFHQDGKQETLLYLQLTNQFLLLDANFQEVFKLPNLNFISLSSIVQSPNSFTLPKNYLFMECPKKKRVVLVHLPSQKAIEEFSFDERSIRCAYYLNDNCLMVGTGTQFSDVGLYILNIAKKEKYFLEGPSGVLTSLKKLKNNDVFPTILLDREKRVLIAGIHEKRYIFKLPLSF